MSPSDKKSKSKREDLDSEPANAGKVGEKNKQMNEKGEAERPGTPPDPKTPL
jgi:hypothetical protein